jgi:hypothetical protein
LQSALDAARRASRENRCGVMSWKAHRPDVKGTDRSFALVLGSKAPQRDLEVALFDIRRSPDRLQNSPIEHP